MAMTANPLLMPLLLNFFPFEMCRGPGLNRDDEGAPSPVLDAGAANGTRTQRNYWASRATGH
jgi:hypothetical protein